jgi:hypothetical protein
MGKSYKEDSRGKYNHKRKQKSKNHFRRQNDNYDENWKKTVDIHSN